LVFVVGVIVDEPQGIGNYADGVWAVTTLDLALVRRHGNNEDTRKIKGPAASDRFNYDYGDEEEITRRTAAVAEMALEVKVVANVNFENQGIRAGRRLSQMLNAVRTG